MLRITTLARPLMVGLLLTPALTWAQAQATWGTVLEASAQSGVESAWIDPRGSAFLLTSIGPNAAFGPIQPRYEGPAVVKATAAGQWQWARPLPTSTGAPTWVAQLSQLAGDYQGGFYLAGRFLGTMTFAPGVTLTAVGASDAVIAHYDSTGTFEWVRRVAGSARQGSSATNLAFTGLTTDRLGNAYVGCALTDTLVIGTTRLLPTLSNSFQVTDLAVAKIDPQGDWQWVARSGGPADEVVGGLAADGSGHLYVAGTLSAGRGPGPSTDTVARFGGNKLMVPISYVGPGTPFLTEGYVARLDAATGQWDWAVQTRGSASGFSRVLAGLADNVYVVGHSYQGRFGTIPSPGTGLCIARLSATLGTCEWLAPGPQAPDLWMVGAGLNPRTEDVLLTGTFADSLTFGGLRVNRDSLSYRTGSDRIFAAALDSSGHPNWALASSNNGGYRANLGVSIGADDQGQTYVAGHYANRLNLGPRDLLNNTPNSGALFLARVDIAQPTGLPGTGAPVVADLFPNPAPSGVVVTWQLPTAPSGSIEVLNALGQLVRRVPAPGATVRVPTAGLPAGLYVLRALTSGGAHTQRLVVAGGE